MEKDEEDFLSMLYKLPADSVNEDDTDNILTQAGIINDISYTCGESIFVIDLCRRQILHVSDHSLFLHEKTPDEIKNMGYNFFHEIIHPDDRKLFIDVDRAILEYAVNPENERGAIRYFSFHIRHNRNDNTPMMTCCKARPVYKDRKLIGLVGAITVSVRPKPGRLELLYMTEKQYGEYSFKDRAWTYRKLPDIKPTERQIMLLFQQGYAGAKIAGILNISETELRNVEQSLFRKLDVHSIFEAFMVADNLGITS